MNFNIQIGRDSFEEVMLPDQPEESEDENERNDDNYESEEYDE